jgi:hypothetical protein
MARIGAARLIVGYGAIACALPYLALKFVWLSGGQLGVSDPVMMRDASMIALNTTTAIMDMVGIGIALAFTHAWGLRAPAWLVLPPMWVASGLLSRFALAGPIAVIATVMAPQSHSTIRVTGGPVEPWVYAVVYTEFAGLGIGLMLAFVLYARRRWTFVFHPTRDADSLTHDLQVPLARAAAVMAGLVALVQLSWAAGATFGLDRDVAAQRTFVSTAVNTIDATMTIAAGAGVLAIVDRLGRPLTFWRWLALTWLGGGALFAWGLWTLINVLGNTALVRGRVVVSGLLNFVALTQLLTGLVIGLVMLFVLAERHANEHALPPAARDA